MEQSAPNQPTTEQNLQPESKERTLRAEVLKAVTKVHSLWDRVYGKKTESGTLTDTDRKEFSLFNFGVVSLDKGKGKDLQRNFKVDISEGRVMRGPRVDGALAFIEAQLVAEKDERTRQELEDAKRIFEGNSKNFFTKDNENRKSLRDPLVKERAKQLARIYEGSDEHTDQHLSEAAESLAQEKELIIPLDSSSPDQIPLDSDSPIQVPVADTMLEEDTLDGLMKKLHEALPPEDPQNNIIPLDRTVPGTTGMLSQEPTPITEARSAIIQETRMREAEEQRRKDAERFISKNETAIVQGALSDKPNVLRFDKDFINARITAMQDQTTITNAAVDKISTPLSSPREESPMQSQENVDPAVPLAEGVDELSEADMLDPISMAEYAGRHPDQFADEGEAEVSTPEATSPDASPAFQMGGGGASIDGSGENPVNATSLMLRDTPAEATEPKNDSFDTTRYVAAHNDGNPDVPTDLPEPTPLPVASKKSFFSKLGEALGLTRAA